MTVTRESRRMSRVTPPIVSSVTFAVSHGTPSRPVPSRPESCLWAGLSLGVVTSPIKVKFSTRERAGR